MLPRIVLTAGFLAISRSIPTVRHVHYNDAVIPDDLASVLESPAGIEWIKAAGNYVEVRRGGRTLLLRSTMQSLERMLDNSRFVRIHRQVIVNTDYVDTSVRGRSGNVVQLKDGTTFKVGNRYGTNWSLAAN